MNISQKYLLDTEEYLASLMSEIYPNMNFTEGSNNRDLIIRPMAMALAIIQYNIARSEQVYKILSGEVSVDDDMTNVVYNLMRNWFLTPRGATVSRGVAYLELANRAGTTIQPFSKFVFGTVEFSPDILTPIIYNPSDLIPIYDVNGRVIKYMTPSFPIVSRRAGAGTNLKPGATSNTFYELTSNVIKVVCPNGTIGGEDAEDAKSCISRLSTALVTRNLLSKQSIITVLNDAFNDLDKIVPIGYEDPEMIRNKIFFMSKYYNMGGKDDIYIARMPFIETKESTIGGEYLSYEKKCKYLEILDYSLGYNHSADYIEIISSSPLYSQMVAKGLPTKFIINKVLAPNYFEISPALPTTVDLPAGEYKIGSTIIDKPGSIGQIFKWDNMVKLQPPVLAINYVQIKDPLSLTPFRELTYTSNPNPAIDEYTIYVPEPNIFNSYKSDIYLKFHPDNNKYMVRVSYYTFKMEDVDNFLNNEAIKIISLDRLVRACYLINVRMSINYTTSFGGVLNRDRVRESISEYIRSINKSMETLTSDKIKRHILDNFPVDDVPLVSFSWSILTPEGVVLEFSSLKEVSLRVENLVSSQSNMAYLSKYNISDRICYFYCNPNSIVISEV